MADTPLPSPELLRQLLTYDADTGLLYWKRRPQEMFTVTGVFRMWNTRYAGREAFALVGSHGYKYGRLFKRGLLGHRVVFALVHGHWPSTEIDHINGIRTDNRVSNLREVSSSENSRNCALRINNISGVLGVHRVASGKWVAQICGRHVGCFSSLKAAHLARRSAEAELGYHVNSGRSA